ncbi:hypothetical protein F511_30087 [Dorcoceras hygrometricum]|uniref:Uncharacterized protein n=1 Tax=Dorcoceras hygrometricum TaxID=472368 RepID=A0A2Z7BMP6_9LAMI|nr:hypothetical protein F511_30087 [Dorcoceras hygrometricum]
MSGTSCEEQKPDVDVKRDLESTMMTSVVMSSQSAVVKRSARAGSVLMKSAVTSAISREIQCNQQLSQDTSRKVPVARYQSQDTSRKVPVAEYTSRKMMNQSQATMHPVAGYSVLLIQSQEIQSLNRDVKQVLSEQPRAGRVYEFSQLLVAGSGLYTMYRSYLLVEPSEDEEGET